MTDTEESAKSLFGLTFSIFRSPACDVCKIKKKDTLWLCLYTDCYMLGCSEGKDHSSTHNHKNDSHCIQMNIDSRRLWCYKCSNEVR